MKNEEEAGFTGIDEVPMDSAINAALKKVQGKVLRAFAQQNPKITYFSMLLDNIRLIMQY
jgi:hypothetical protein